MVLEIGAGSGPELPMQVVQPKPTRLKPSLSRSFLQAGLGEIFGHDLAAGRQRGLHPGLGLEALGDGVAGERPAPISTLGFEVLVHDVMAAMATSPWPRS
jgi:hypothetical protein